MQKTRPSGDGEPPVKTAFGKQKSTGAADPVSGSGSSAFGSFGKKAGAPSAFGAKSTFPMGPNPPAPTPAFKKNATTTSSAQPAATATPPPAPSADMSERAIEQTAWVEEQAKSLGAAATRTVMGSYIRVVTKGTGPNPKISGKAVLGYEGRLSDGTLFDSSKQSAFPCNKVVPGLAAALPLMSCGGTYEVFIPPEKGYGSKANGKIPADSALVFKVTLQGVSGGDDAAKAPAATAEAPKKVPAKGFGNVATASGTGPSSSFGYKTKEPAAEAGASTTPAATAATPNPAPKAFAAKTTFGAAKPKGFTGFPAKNDAKPAGATKPANSKDEGKDDESNPFSSSSLGGKAGAEKKDEPRKKEAENKEAPSEDATGNDDDTKDDPSKATSAEKKPAFTPGAAAFGKKPTGVSGGAASSFAPKGAAKAPAASGFGAKAKTKAPAFGSATTDACPEKDPNSSDSSSSDDEKEMDIKEPPKPSPPKPSKIPMPSSSSPSASGVNLSPRRKPEEPKKEASKTAKPDPVEVLLDGVVPMLPNGATHIGNDYFVAAIEDGDSPVLIARDKVTPLRFNRPIDVHLVTPDSSKGMHRAIASPDQQYVAFVSCETHHFIVELQTERVIDVTINRSDCGGCIAAVWHPTVPHLLIMLLSGNVVEVHSMKNLTIGRFSKVVSRTHVSDLIATSLNRSADNTNPDAPWSLGAALSGASFVAMDIVKELSGRPTTLLLLSKFGDVVSAKISAEGCFVLPSDPSVAEVADEQVRMGSASRAATSRGARDPTSPTITPPQQQQIRGLRSGSRVSESSSQGRASQESTHSNPARGGGQRLFATPAGDRDASPEATATGTGNLVDGTLVPKEDHASSSAATTPMIQVVVDSFHYNTATAAEGKDVALGIVHCISDNRAGGIVIAIIFASGRIRFFLRLEKHIIPHDPKFDGGLGLTEKFQKPFYTVVVGPPIKLAAIATVTESTRQIAGGSGKLLMANKNTDVNVAASSSRAKLTGSQASGLPKSSSTRSLGEPEERKRFLAYNTVSLQHNGRNNFLLNYEEDIFLITVPVWNLEDKMWAMGEEGTDAHRYLPPASMVPNVHPTPVVARVPLQGNGMSAALGDNELLLFPRRIPGHAPWEDDAFPKSMPPETVSKLQPVKVHIAKILKSGLYTNQSEAILTHKEAEKKQEVPPSNAPMDKWQPTKMLEDLAATHKMIMYSDDKDKINDQQKKTALQCEAHLATLEKRSAEEKQRVNKIKARLEALRSKMQGQQAGLEGMLDTCEGAIAQRVGGLNTIKMMNEKLGMIHEAIGRIEQEKEEQKRHRSKVTPDRGTSIDPTSPSGSGDAMGREQLSPRSKNAGAAGAPMSPNPRAPPPKQDGGVSPWNHV